MGCIAARCAQALASPLPPLRRTPVGRPAPKLGAYRALIDAWLVADREAPRKQRHTAQADLAAARRRARCRGVGAVDGARLRASSASARWAGRSTRCSCRRSTRPGSRRRSTGARPRSCSRAAATTVHLFVMRAWFSGAAFCQAFERETQQAFLEAHVAGVRVVRRRVRDDPLRQPASRRSSRCCKGRRRVERTGSSRLRSHYLFDSQFTTPGNEGAHEKGGVEGEVGRYRRNHLVPVPEVADLAELNARLLEAGCEADLGRRIDGRAGTVGEALGRGAAAAARAAGRAVRAGRARRRRGSIAKALVTIRQNRYSVPVALVGLRVSARIGAREITISHAGREVARHERLHGRFGTSAQLDHYLELLKRKPGALERSLALSQERERGCWPDCFDELWAADRRPLRRSEAARQMVDVAAALPRARPRPGRARRPRRARRRRASTAARSRCSPAAPRRRRPRPRR